MGSNRTFMELKWTIDTNGVRRLLSSNRTFMELKLALPFALTSSSCCSNRTFMELKCLQRFGPGLAWHVLIVPLWN